MAYPTFGGNATPTATVDYTSAVGNGTTATNINITLPSGIAATDVIFIAVGNDFNAATAQWDAAGVTGVTGFDLLTQYNTASADACYAIYYKVSVDGSEAGQVANVSTAAGIAAQDQWAIAWRVSDARLGDPVGVLGVVRDNSSAASHPVTGPTPTENEILAFMVGSADGADTAPYTFSGSTWAELAQVATTGGTATSTVGGMVAWISWPTQTAITNCTVAFTGVGGADGFAGQIFTVKSYAKPAIITERLNDSTGTPYPDGTQVYCYTAIDGAMRDSGPIGSICGVFAGDPNVPAVTPNVGEITVTFPSGTTNPRFLVVDPSVDTDGLVTNPIVPTQLV